jgi:hypothetical protein
MTMRRGSTLAALVLAGGACALPAHADTPLSGDAIRKLVSGRSASWVSAEGRSGTITYNPDGTIAAKARAMGMNFSVKGTWEVKGNRFCRTISMDSPPTKCQTVIPAGGKTYRFIGENGKLATTTTFN